MRAGARPRVDVGRGIGERGGGTGTTRQARATERTERGPSRRRGSSRVRARARRGGRGRLGCDVQRFTSCTFLRLAGADMPRGCCRTAAASSACNESAGRGDQGRQFRRVQEQIYGRLNGQGHNGGQHRGRGPGVCVQTPLQGRHRAQGDAGPGSAMVRPSWAHMHVRLPDVGIEMAACPPRCKSCRSITKLPHRKM